MMYNKMTYSTQGGVSCQIQHEAKLSAVLSTQPHPSYHMYRALHAMML